MDDFVLIHTERKILESALTDIRNMVEAIGLHLNRKTQIFPLRHGIEFLKWHFYLTDTGRVIRKISGRSVAKERRKLKKLARQAAEGRIPSDYIWLSYQSWRANARRGNTYRTVCSMERLYTELMEGIENGRSIKGRGEAAETDAAG